MESRVLRWLVPLGVPGVALGVFYLILKAFGFSFTTIGATASAGIAVLFLLIVGGITFYALHRWAPPKDDVTAIEIERFRGAITAKFLELRRTLKEEERKIREDLRPGSGPRILGDSPETRLSALRDFAAKVRAIESAFNRHIDKRNLYKAHEELNKLRRLALEQESFIEHHQELYRLCMTADASGGGFHGGLIALGKRLRQSLDGILEAIEAKSY